MTDRPRPFSPARVHGWPESLLLFSIATVGYQSTQVFYDALLGSITTEENRGRISGLGMACGYLGIEQRLEPTQECAGDAYQSAEALPRSLAEAVSLLRADRDLVHVLGPEFLTVYTEIKDLEHEEFMRVISPWEREHLLLHV